MMARKIEQYHSNADLQADNTSDPVAGILEVIGFVEQLWFNNFLSEDS